jgi:hypothetical protein
VRQITQNVFLHTLLFGEASLSQFFKLKKKQQKKQNPVFSLAGPIARNESKPLKKI